jgi:hypothetical protein
MLMILPPPFRLQTFERGNFACVRKKHATSILTLHHCIPSQPCNVIGIGTAMIPRY